MADDPDQSGRVAKLLGDCARRDEPMFLNGVVLCETVWVLERGYGVARDVIADVLEKVLLTRQFEVEDREQVWRAQKAYKDGKADFADYLIGERNGLAGCRTTVTFDAALNGTEGFELL